MSTVPWSGEPATTCTWCGHDFDADSARPFGRVTCAECTAATTDPVPNEAALEDAYGNWYWPERSSRFGLFGDAMLRRSRASMAKRIDAAAPHGAVLDVGAGEGTLIDALTRRGRRAIGIDRQSGHPAVDDRPMPAVEGEFAAVVFWHSLEHLPEPGKAISEAVRLLEPGGVIFIAVPNNASLQAAAFGNRWLHLDLPRHLNHQTLESLRTGLDSRGFSVGRVSFTRGGQIVIGWLDGFVGTLPGELNLYQSLRRRSARRIAIGPARRAAAIAAGVILFPVAVACSVLEIVTRRSGTVYLEAERVRTK